MGNMPYVNEQIKAKYPNVIFDSTTIILENVDIILPPESVPVPAGTIVFNGPDENFYVLSNTGASFIRHAIGVILDYKDGKATILIRGLVKGKLYYHHPGSNDYQEHPQKLFPNVIKMED
jgi:hypothetical protein